ncbi:MAG: hypothetical protein V3G42_10275 [Oscillospiraceae bacterium]
MSNLTEITQRLDALYQGYKKSKKMSDSNKKLAAKLLIDMTFMEESTLADVAVQLAKFPALTTKAYFETLIEKAPVELIDEVLKEFSATDKDVKTFQSYPPKFSSAVVAIVKNAPEKAQQLKPLQKFVEFVARFAIKTDKSEKRYFKDMVNDTAGKIYLLDYSTLKKGELLNIWNATKSIYPNLKESKYEKFILEWAEKYALIPKSIQDKTPKNPPEISHDEKPVVEAERIQEKKLETPCDKKPVDEVAKTPVVSAETPAISEKAIISAVTQAIAPLSQTVTALQGEMKQHHELIAVNSRLSAKVNELEQQIETLNQRIQEANQTSQSEKKTLTNKITELETLNAELDEKLKDVYSINSRESSLEAEKIRTDLKRAFEFLYDDWLDYEVSSVSEENYESLQAIIKKIFRVLEKNGIQFKGNVK